MLNLFVQPRNLQAADINSPHIKKNQQKKQRKKNVLKSDQRLKHEILHYFLSPILVVAFKARISKEISNPWVKRSFNLPNKCCQNITEQKNLEE